MKKQKIIGLPCANAIFLCNTLVQNFCTKKSVDLFLGLVYKLTISHYKGWKSDMRIE